MNEKTKETLKDVLSTIIMFVGIVAVMLPLFIKPIRFTGVNILSKMKKVLTIILVCDAVAVVFYIYSIIRAIYIINALLDLRRDMNDLGQTFSDYGESTKPVHQVYKALMFKFVISVAIPAIVLVVSLFSIFQASHTVMSTGTDENNPWRIMQSLENIALDEQEGKTVTVEIGEPIITKASALFMSPGGRYSSGSEHTEEYCWITLDDGRRLPLGAGDASSIGYQLFKLPKGRYALKLEYYEHSGLIKSYSLVKSEWQAENYSMPDVEITIDDDYTLHRPENMARYGDIAWVIKRDGEMLRLYDYEEYDHYTTIATHYDSLDLNEKTFFHNEPGSYSIQLVKVFTYQDVDTGLYTDIVTTPISNEITFTIKEVTKITGEEIIKLLDGKMIEITFDEADMIVQLPKLADEYDIITGVYLICDLSGIGHYDEYFDSRYEDEEYRYYSGEAIQLKEYSCHYKLYVAALDENDEYVIISNVIEFDHITEELKERQEYFYDVLTALENDDTEAIKAMLSERTISVRDEVFLNKNLNKMCEIYQGTTLDRENIDPYIYDYISPVNGGHLYIGELKVKTDCGSCEIDLKTCLEAEDSSYIGVYEIKVRNLDTNDAIYVNDS